MTVARELQGRCLCGAITVTVDGPLGDVSACHCDYCRRWSGSLQMGVEVDADKVKTTGPFKTHQSTPLAERAWCDTCGSALWFRYTSDRNAGYIELAPGLFEDFGGARLTRVVYSDKCPGGLTIGGDPERVTKAAYEAANPHVEAAR